MMPKRDDQQTARVQVYFENPKTELALRREARAGKLTLSRAAERAIERGLQLNRSKGESPDDVLRAVARRLDGHAKSTARDFGWLMELNVALARTLFVRLPEHDADRDPDLLAATEARIERLLDEVASRLERGGRRPVEPDTRPEEPRSFQIAANR
ncbi:MAG: hypothetical protein KJ861_00725 [Alphaproteobacteria bacterium]|nr:hypothetical protein [Alphaproteobacteria bacterium]